MALEVSPQVLLDVGADLAWPEVPGLVHAGEALWREAVSGAPPLTPGERICLLAAVSPAMLSITAVGRARLEKWTLAELERPTPSVPPEVQRRRIRRVLSYYGDPSMLPHVVEALLLAPSAVREVVLASVAVLGTGWDARGWTGGAALLGPTGEPVQRLIVLDGAAADPEALTRTTLHEIGHVWNHATDPSHPVLAMQTVGQENFLALAHEEGFAARNLAVRAQDERRADALALAWLCAGAA